MVLIIMEDKRTMPVCFKPEELKLIEDFAKKLGMINSSQAIEKIISDLRQFTYPHIFFEFVQESNDGLYEFIINLY